ncbi:MAG: hypothetical protein ACRDNM_15135 [Gaiellaceae bacterium]
MTIRPLLVAAVLAALGLIAAGCGAAKTPSVAGIGATHTTSAASASGQRDPAAFARCMSSHGFAASVGSAGTAGDQELSIAGVVIGGNVDPSSPQFQTAMQACRKFLPGGGPQPLSPAQQAEHAKAMANFAACMRKHGAPNFPDPNAQGMFTPRQLGGRLQPDSPVVRAAFKRCESLEPKVGPPIELG